jgi:predicted Rossmann-fold nucleotide-binding protein
VNRRRGRIVEIDTVDEFTALVARGAQRMSGWRVQGVDLSSHSAELRAVDPAGSLFLGVTLADDDVAWLREHGALVFPHIPELPFDPYRSELYTPGELYAGIETKPYSSTLDAQVYAWSRQQVSDPTRTLSQALHDHAIDVALDSSIAGRRCVGVMGGHAVDRDDPGYRQAVDLGRTLTRAGLMVVTGGGPGAMEAANLGSYLADETESAIDAAIAVLAEVPSFRPSTTRWARTAFEVRARWPQGRESLGIPTWFYGHEPPNAFASQIAKYFRNALREDTLLSRCDAGIMFLPGAAGTVQEVFQDACENYYADAANVAPMVLVGTEYWTSVVPVWPLLEQLAKGRPMQKHIHLAEDVSAAVAILAQ